MEPFTALTRDRAARGRRHATADDPRPVLRLGSVHVLREDVDGIADVTPRVRPRTTGEVPHLDSVRTPCCGGGCDINGRAVTTVSFARC